MTRVLLIFQKDLRRLWRYCLVFWGVMALAAATDPLPTPAGAIGAVSLGSVVSFQVFEALACWLLIVLAIQQERLVGDNQYWLTRPIAPLELLAAKVLFLVATINLPLLICHCATLAALSISPLAYMPALLVRQLFFTAMYVLPAVAVAAITRSVAQVALVGIVVTAVVMVLLFGMLPLGNPSLTPSLLIAVVVAAATAVVLVVQYARRREWLARSVAAAGLIGVLILLWIPWEPGPRYGMWRPLPEGQSLEMSFDSSRAGEQAPFRPSPDPAKRTIAIPMTIDNPPAGVTLSLDPEMATVDIGPQRYRAEIVTKLVGLPWLKFDLPAAVYTQLQAAPLALKGTVGAARRYQVPPRGDFLVPGLGRCRVEHLNIAPIPYACNCYAPSHPLSFALADKDGWSGQSAAEPVPTAASFRPLDGKSVYFDHEPSSALWLVTGDALVNYGGHFELRGIRLNQYLVH
ncbi:MAG: hypothetical protein ABSC23_08440 [Bryobacteraceae bacterium]|jgi:hypothetical protein